jgi:hypothetical protein
VIPWTEYLLGVLVAAYREFETRVGMLTTTKGAKSEMVIQAIDGFYGEFSVKEIQSRCPHVGIDLIRRILREMKKAGTLGCSGPGPNARWWKI